MTTPQVFLPDLTTSHSLPLFLARVSAGFPSPADDYLEGRLDLNKHLIKHSAATFFVRASGDSMIGAGIHSEDILVVDRSLEPANNSVVIAVVNGELTVKRILSTDGKLFLVSENPNYHPIKISEDMEFEVWGVVTSVIHSL
jgi:DNA polymerase V